MTGTTIPMGRVTVVMKHLLVVTGLSAFLLSGCVLDGSSKGGGTSGVVSDGTPVIALSWRPNPSTVDGYSVYYGATPDSVNYHFADFNVDQGAIDANSPSVEISAYYDLGVRDGENVCFSIQAFNNYGTSKPSTPVCTAVN